MTGRIQHRILSRQCNGDAGFSLIELMTALAITLIVVAGVLGSFVAQSRVQLVQETIAEDQGNLRAGMELLKRDIRNAGFELDDSTSLQTGNNTGLNGTDEITMFSNGLAENRIYYGVRNDANGVPTLVRNSDPNGVVGNALFAIPNAEDLQLAYGWDANANNVIDAGEWVNNPAGNEANVSAIRINLLVRAARFDSRRQNYRRPAIEDRAAAGATDAFPRRLLTTIVQIRNKGL